MKINLSCLVLALVMLMGTAPLKAESIADKEAREKRQRIAAERVERARIKAEKNVRRRTTGQPAGMMAQPLLARILQVYTAKLRKVHVSAEILSPVIYDTITVELL